MKDVSLIWVGGCAGLIIEALVTDGHKMVVIQRLDVRRHLLRPVRDRDCGTASRSGTSRH